MMLLLLCIVDENIIASMFLNSIGVQKYYKNQSTSLLEIIDSQILLTSLHQKELL